MTCRFDMGPLTKIAACVMVGMVAVFVSAIVVNMLISEAKDAAAHGRSGRAYVAGAAAWLLILWVGLTGMVFAIFGL